MYYGAGGAFRVIKTSGSSTVTPGLYFSHGDHLGSVSVLSDSTGLKVDGSEVVCAPFGEVRDGTRSTLTDFGYTGQIHDDSTGGLMFYNARYYLPELRRFISADTIVPGAATSQVFNRYAYALNNPVKYIDPTGHAVDCNCDGNNTSTGGNDISAYTFPTAPVFIEKIGSGIGDFLKTKEDNLREALEEVFKVTVTFDASITDISDRITALENIYTAVVAYGIRLAELQGRMEGFANDAFVEHMGPTHFKVLNSIYVTCGTNKKAQGCNDNKENGVFQIRITLNGLLGTVWGLRQSAQGANLAAHELGHNLTWQDVYYPNANNDNKFFGVNANSGNADEWSANAFGSWALDKWEGSQLRKFGISPTQLQTDIGECILAPNSAACSEIRP